MAPDSNQARGLSERNWTIRYPSPTRIHGDESSSETGTTQEMFSDRSSGETDGDEAPSSPIRHERRISSLHTEMLWRQRRLALAVGRVQAQEREIRAIQRQIRSRQESDGSGDDSERPRSRRRFL